MIMITLNKIAAKEPCASGWAKILHARGKIDADQLAEFLADDDVPSSFNKLADDEQFPLSLALESNGLDDTLWALQCLPDDHRLWRKYAVWCARQVQHLMTDPRSINALDVSDRHADGLATDQELAAAWDAAWAAARDAAWAAAWAAAWDAARDAAWDAARDAAWDAARAAARAAAWDAAWDAARAAARAAAWDAARDAAWAAAWDAAWAAARAAARAAAWDAAWDAARAAARAAAWDAARASQKAKLLQILEAGHWVE